MTMETIYRGYRLRMFDGDEGDGKSVWHVFGADGHRIAVSVATFAQVCAWVDKMEDET